MSLYGEALYGAATYGGTAVTPAAPSLPPSLRGLVLIDPDGAALDLGSIGGHIVAAPGVSLGGMPPITRSVQRVPLQPGGRLRQTSHDVRQVTIPVTVLAPNPSALEALEDQLMWALDPTRGDTTVRVTRHDGTTRDLAVRLIDAPPVVEGYAGETARSTVLVFEAVDPYWYGPERSESFQISDPVVVPFFPILPLRLSTSGLAGGVNVTNGGQVAAWPVITVNGPGADLVITNTTTGAVMTLGGVIAAGASVVVDTRPGHKTVTSGGVGVFGQLGGHLWPLAPGANGVEVSFGAATTASSVTVAWRDAWLTT